MRFKALFCFLVKNVQTIQLQQNIQYVFSINQHKCKLSNVVVYWGWI